MGARPITINIAGERLKSLLATKEVSIATAAEQLGISRQAFNGWIKSGKLPLPRFLELTKKFSFSSQELDSIHVQEEVYVQFRTHRHKEVPVDSRDQIKQVAMEYFTHGQPLAPLLKEIKFHVQTRDVKSMADQLRKSLSISEYPITLSQTLAATANASIPVLFIQFDSRLQDHSAKAFRVSYGQRNLVFLDSNLPLQDVTWHLFHELTHVFAGDTDDYSRESEEFCNAVASEVLTPSSFFDKEEVRKFLKTELKQTGPHLVQVIDEIASHLGASFMGVVLALKTNRLLEGSSPAYRYLWGAVNKRKKHTICVADLISPFKEEDPLDFWSKALIDPNRTPFLRFHKAIIHGLKAEKVSLSRAAEVFDVDVVTMRQISAAQDFTSDAAETSH